MKIEKAFLLISFLGWAVFASAQSLDLHDDYSFFQSISIPVITNNDTLSMPWTGGMNSIRFSEIDLNGDSHDDLFAFEKHGNRILTFLNEGDHYTYAPEYAEYFPSLHDWAILQDYNNDGKPDIFTYGLAGISVYKNITNGNHPQFQLVTEQLNAYYYNGYVNIFASPDDYLVVDDIDNDGHLDILNFWVLGKFVHHLRNYSNDPDIFDFHLESECWGHFEEAEDNNLITLFSDCSRKSGDDDHLRHTGSSMLLHDFDHNGLPDLLLGDVDSPNLIMLYNHGTLSEARMTAQDSIFPANAPVQLFSMPATSIIHTPGATKPTLIASPSDPSLTKSQDLNSVWRYDYDTLLQQYTLTNTAFLQEHMLDVGSGSHPVLFDWDNDGLLDLFVSNYGSFDSVRTINGWATAYFSSSIHYYKNVGSSTHPAFELQDEDFGHLKALNYQALHPTFGDFDSDGQTDMLCGQKDGTLLFVPHQRIIDGSGNIIDNYQNIDVGAYSTPTFFDLDNDGLNDLIIGNQRGLLSFYKNTGNYGQPNFTLITDTLGQVDVRDFNTSYFGYSVPCFHRDDIHGTTLACGGEDGNLHYYNISDPNDAHASYLPNNLITVTDSSYENLGGRSIHDGKRSSFAFADLNNDSYPELIVGNYAGGLTFLKGRAPISHETGIEGHTNNLYKIQPNPTSGHIQIDSNGQLVKSVILYDLCGRLLLQTNENQVDISTLPSGIYILEINHTVREKVVKR